MTDDNDPALPASAQEELGFWSEELSLDGNFADVLRGRVEKSRRKEEFPAFLDPILPILQARFQLTGPARCIEIGSGPLSTLSWGVDAGVLDVTALDVLADEYAVLLERAGIEDFPVRPRNLGAEDICEHYSDESFHLAFARNSLDHTLDVPRAFDNLVRVLRPDGLLVLQHHVNEGSRQNWSDSHQWNLDMVSGPLTATKRSGESFTLFPRADPEPVLVSYRSYVLDGWMDLAFRKLATPGE